MRKLPCHLKNTRDFHAVLATQGFEAEGHSKAHQGTAGHRQNLSISKPQQIDIEKLNHARNTAGNENVWTILTCSCQELAIDESHHERLSISYFVRHKIHTVMR